MYGIPPELIICYSVGKYLDYYFYYSLTGKSRIKQFVIKHSLFNKICWRGTKVDIAIEKCLLTHKKKMTSGKDHRVTTQYAGGIIPQN